MDDAILSFQVQALPIEHHMQRQRMPCLQLPQGFRKSFGAQGHGERMAFLQKRRAHMLAQKAAGTCDEDPHGLGWLRCAEKCIEAAGNVLQMVCAKSWIDTDPESLVHDAIGICQATADAIGAALHVRLLEQVAGKQQPCADAVPLKMVQQIETAESRIFFQGDGKAEPGGVRAGRWLGKNEKFL